MRAGISALARGIEVSHPQGSREGPAAGRAIPRRRGGKSAEEGGALMDLVFEIGCEELPAGAQQPAVEWMAGELSRRLQEKRLGGAALEIKQFATPRRLALIATGIEPAAQNERKRVQGPPFKAAFAEGKPTKAAEGFARKLGVSIGDLKVEGDRVVVDQMI